MGEVKRRKAAEKRMVWVDAFQCYVPALLMKTIYTFVDMEGVNVNIDAAALRKWCLKSKLEVHLAPIDHELAHSFVRENTISLQRVKQIISNHILLNEPVIFCKDGTFADDGGPNVMLVDGHHRYFVYSYMQLNCIPCYLLEVEQWKPFQMHNLPEVTREQLMSIPVIKRDYHK